MKPYTIGVMQGRLLPKYKGRYQAHPVGYWQDEFRIAAILGLDLIEFILDFDKVDHNPLMHDSGLDTIMRLTTETGVRVKSVCADYFMEAPFHSTSDLYVHQSQNVLITLIENASKIGVSDVVIPCVDKSRLVDEHTVNLFLKNIRPALEQAEMFGINLALETDLAPAPFAGLLEKLVSPRITVNYDIGNSASLGYDPAEEMKAYGNKITDIHIKDRVRGGGSVMLGTGAADFEKFFSALSKTDYSGPFIMQAYRDDEGLAIFKKQLEWIKPRLESWSITRGFA